MTTEAFFQTLEKHCLAACPDSVFLGGLPRSRSPRAVAMARTKADEMARSKPKADETRARTRPSILAEALRIVKAADPALADPAPKNEEKRPPRSRSPSRSRPRWASATLSRSRSAPSRSRSPWGNELLPPPLPPHSLDELLAAAPHELEVPPCGLAWKCPPVVEPPCPAWDSTKLQRWWDQRRASHDGDDGISDATTIKAEAPTMKATTKKNNAPKTKAAPKTKRTRASQTQTQVKHKGTQTWLMITPKEKAPDLLRRAERVERMDLMGTLQRRKNSRTT